MLDGQGATDGGDLSADEAAGLDTLTRYNSVERQQPNVPQRSVAGTTATVVTQETWSNQEAGTVAPDQPPCVTYTLRCEASEGRWLIADSTMSPL